MVLAAGILSQLDDPFSSALAVVSHFVKSDTGQGSTIHSHDFLESNLPFPSLSTVRPALLPSDLSFLTQHSPCLLLLLLLPHSRKSFTLSTTLLKMEELGQVLYPLSSL